MEPTSAPDALTAALDAVSDRWSLHVVRALALGARRFTDIVRETGVPRDVLSARLRKLRADAIVQPTSPESPSGRGYELTQKGHDLAQVLLVLKRWGDMYSDADIRRLELVHRGCGQLLQVQVCCESCGRPVAPGDAEVLR